MLIVEILASPVFFSIRIPETFQVADTLLLPPPSTIGGAFAYSYATWKNYKFQDALKIFANAWFFAIPLNYIVVSSVILRRCRLLQVGEPLIRGRNWRTKLKNKLPSYVYEILERKGLLSELRNDRRSLLNILKKANVPYYWHYYSTTFFDAMIRRYAFTGYIYIGGIIPVDEQFVPCFTRLGDTESFISLQSINFVKNFDLNVISSGEVKSDSYVFLTYEETEIARPLEPLPIQMMSTPIYIIKRYEEKHRRVERRHVFPAVLPLRMEIKHIAGRNIEIYIPTKVRVEIRSKVQLISYKSKILNRIVNVVVPSKVKIL